MTLWKTPNIKPDMFRSHHIIVDYEAKGHTEPMLSTEYAELTADRYVNRWCYLDCLITQADKAERLQKAVDLLSKYLQLYMDDYANEFDADGIYNDEIERQKRIWNEIKQLTKEQ